MKESEELACIDDSLGVGRPSTFKGIEGYNLCGTSIDLAKDPKCVYLRKSIGTGEFYSSATGKTPHKCYSCDIPEELLNRFKVLEEKETEMILQIVKRMVNEANKTIFQY